MGFPMTVERVVNRNHLDRDNAALMDDLRRLAEDSATLAAPVVLREAAERVVKQHALGYEGHVFDESIAELRAALQ